ncbi:MAG: hypothetical protein QOJ65_2096 [Fimbriimonadaceae bacterium]|nr:hypothetical protein [Fimbriimonadaceae bacterium]
MFLLAAVACIASQACNRAATPAAVDAPKPVVEVTLAPVKRASLRATVSVTGTLAPLPSQEAKVAPLVAGKIQRMLVKTGDNVQKGQVIATLDPGMLLGQIQQAQGTIATSQATLNQSKVNYRSQIASQQASVEQARSNLQAQEIALQRLRAGSRPQEVAQAQSNVVSAQAGLQNAQQNLGRSQTLFSQGLLARKDLEAAQAAERTARSQVQNAEAALSLVKQGNRPEDIAAGRNAVLQAQQQLRAAQNQAVQNAAKAQDIRIAEGQLQNAIGALKSARAQLTALTVRSPLSGVVAGATPNPGEYVDTTGALATIVNLSAVRVLLNVPLAQISEVRPGQEVVFTTEADPSRVHSARVTVVGTAVDPATNTVPVEAIAGNADRSLRDDGLVKAEIVVDEHSNALVVPVDAVVDKGGKPTVFTVTADNIAHAKEVKVGIRQGSLVEILSGLQEGDKVVVKGAFELEDGTQVQTTG